jgi:hypothetical protein
MNKDGKMAENTAKRSLFDERVSNTAADLPLMGRSTRWLLFGWCNSSTEKSESIKRQHRSK